MPRSAFRAASDGSSSVPRIVPISCAATVASAPTDTNAPTYPAAVAADIPMRFNGGVITSMACLRLFMLTPVSSETVTR